MLFRHSTIVFQRHGIGWHFRVLIIAIASVLLVFSAMEDKTFSVAKDGGNRQLLIAALNHKLDLTLRFKFIDRSDQVGRAGNFLTIYLQDDIAGPKSRACCRSAGEDIRDPGAGLIFFVILQVHSQPWSLV